jgi:hypothetical protein
MVSEEAEGFAAASSSAMVSAWISEAGTMRKEEGAPSTRSRIS